MRVLLNVFIHLRLEEAMTEEPLAQGTGLDDAAITEQVAQLLLHGLLRR